MPASRPPSLRHIFAAVSLLSLTPGLGACTTEELADKASDKGRELADKAGDKSRELADKAGDKGKELAGELGDRARDEAGRIWGERPSNGELSDSAMGILRAGAGASGEGAEALLARGEQLAPVAAEVARTLAEVVDSDRMIEPIVQDLDDEAAQAKLDARITDMPRVETIDGVDVGFKDVTQYDSAGRETESAYLILWRRDDRLLGLIYRSKQRLNIDVLVKEAPRLLALVQGSM